VLDDGTFRDGTEAVAGLTVFDANPVIVELLRERGALLHHEPLSTATRIAGATRRR
jgi:isoleucyl-tRNA synthetase